MSESKTFDPSRPVQTRDGRKARIICTDANNQGGPIIALIERDPIRFGLVDGRPFEIARPYYIGGNYRHDFLEDPIDLVNVPVKTSLFFNIYGRGNPLGVSRKSIKEAKVFQRSSSNHLRYLEIQYEDGIPVSSVIHKA